MQPLAFDYDGTLTRTGRLSWRLVSVLRQARQAGHPLLLVTGRMHQGLLRVCPQAPQLFDRLVLEDGAVIADGTGRTRLLAEPVSDRLMARLRRRKVEAFRGQVLVAGESRDAAVFQEEIEQLGLRCRLSINRHSLMVLPRGVDKGRGFEVALRELGRKPAGSIAFGDAENDRPFLLAAGTGVAVGNAVPALREVADVVLERPASGGVIEYLRGLSRAGARRSGRRG